MLGPMGNGLIPYSPNKFNTWGRPYVERSARRPRNHVRFAAPYFAQAAYGHHAYFGRFGPFRGYAAARSPFSRYAGFGGYSGSYGRSYPRRPRSPTYSGYRMGSSAYRNPYMNFGYGMRPRSGYDRMAWNTPYRRRRSHRRGYAASSRGYDAYASQWYDGDFSDEEDDYYDDDAYEESDYEDADYRPGHGRQRRNAPTYEDSEDDDEFDSYDYDYDDEDDDEYEYEQYDEYSSPYQGYGHQQRRGRRDWS